MAVSCKWEILNKFNIMFSSNQSYYPNEDHSVIERRSESSQQVASGHCFLTYSCHSDLQDLKKINFSQVKSHKRFGSYITHAIVHPPKKKHHIAVYNQ